MLTLGLTLVGLAARRLRRTPPSPPATWNDAATWNDLATWSDAA